MIHSIRGACVKRGGDFVAIETGGVAFKVYTNKRTIELVSDGNEIQMFTYLHVREDILDLFGFLREETLALFELLITVSGVGPKTALGVLELDNVPNITAAILEKRADILTRAPGIGRKTAERVILELHTKVASLAPEASTAAMDVHREVEEVLVSLGYPRALARQTTESQKSGSLEECLRAALKELGTKK